MSEARPSRGMGLRSLALHDDEGHGHLFGETGFAGNAACQNFDGLPAHLIPRHPNGGQARKKLRSELGITVSGDRHVLGDFPTTPMTFLNASDGEHIAGKEHRVDGGIAKFENVERLGAARGSDGHLNLQALRNGHIPALQGFSVADAPLLQAVVAVNGS